MRDGHHILNGVDPWPIGAVLLAFVCLFGITLWFIHRRAVASDGLTPTERKKLPYPDCEVLSMLRQHGGPMMQSEIANEIPIDAEDLAEALKSMETEGLIHRQWEPKKAPISSRQWIGR